MAEGVGVVPVQLARAAQRRVVPGVPALLARGIVGVDVGRKAACLDAGRCGFASGVEVAVGGDRVGWVGPLVGCHAGHASLAPVVRHPKDDLRRGHHRGVLAGGRRVVVVVAGQGGGRAEAKAAAAQRRALVVGVLQVVGHDEQRVRRRGQAGDVEESHGVDRGAGIRVDRQVGAGGERPPETRDEGCERVPRPRRI